jgi:predicted Ser/Thr protein kinase
MEEQRIAYCQDLLLMGQDERFWENIITGDETWCFAYDKATKRQSAEWVRQNSSKPKKLCLKKIASEDDVKCFDMDMSYTRVLHIKVAYQVPHK